MPRTYDPGCPHCHGTGIVHGYWSSDDDVECGCWRDVERTARALEKRARRGAARTGCSLEDARSAVRATLEREQAEAEERRRLNQERAPAREATLSRARARPLAILGLCESLAPPGLLGAALRFGVRR